MGMEAAIIGSTVLGAGLDMFGQSQQQRAVNRRTSQIQGMIAPYLQQGPNPYEAMLTQFYQQLPTMNTELMSRFGGMPGAIGGQAFNTGQDALMQSLRVDPNDRVATALEGMLGGQGFDTTGLFEALQGQDERMVNRQAAALRSGTSGLGERFGSAAALAEGQMRAEAANNAATRNAGIAQSSYENAQNRALSAAGQLSSNRAQQQGVAQALIQAALSQAGLQLQGQQLGLDAARTQAGIQQGDAATRSQLLGMLLNSSNARQGNITQLLSLMAGLPIGQVPNYGQPFGELGQMLLMGQMMRGNNG